ncbi:MAG TPA: T9SS type A sorting domain-containing protein [Bacteroidia bacterium]|nr:T9SS type A sorting domain-containing protein [Bacteroidia bacterium]
MKKALLLITLFIACTAGTLRAQWDSIVRFNQVVEDMVIYNSDLFIAGGFTQYDGNTCYWSGSYDGSSLTPHTTLVGGSGIRKMAVFGTDLYAVGMLSHSISIGVDLWTGTTWTDGGGTNLSHSGIYADGNDLYVVDDNDLVRKKTGTGSFQTFYDFSTVGYLGPIIRYNNKLVFAGTFTSVSGVPANNIVQWDGTNWQALGSGIAGPAMCMAVYNNELYVAGKLTSAGGSPVNNIAKWNGTSWSSVGTGITGVSTYGIRDMKATAGGLFAVGQFTQAGSATTKDVAMWNGSQWYSMMLNHGDVFVTCVEYFNNKVYVGTFDFNHAHLYRYMGTIGIDESNPDKNITLYPNPASDVITIEQKQAAGESVISVFDMSGKKKMVKTTRENKNRVDISGWNAGIYIVEVKSEKGIYRKKIIKD